jgi:flagellar basal-body rod protein FlgG
MSDTISALARAMNNDMEQMRSVSQNLANINTAGYKREVTSMLSFQRALTSGSAWPGSDPAGNRALSGIPRIEVRRDMTQGVMNFSGSDFDFAIQGNGFFEVQTENGNLYTRKGSMKIDEQGRLTLVTGEPVMGESGVIYLRNAPFAIDGQGVITQDDTAGNKLRLVDFDRPEELEYLGNGFFRPPRFPRLTRLVFAGAVLQGYLEASNVETLDEMVKMIETTRHFETSQRVLRGYDQMLDSAINVLGEL